MAKQSPTNTREQAIEIREAWKNIDPGRVYGIALRDLKDGIEALDEVEVRIARLEAQLTDARNMRYERRYAVWDMVKRARRATQAQHGDDSSEYEMFGGTRMSERKRRKGRREQAHSSE